MQSILDKVIEKGAKQKILKNAEILNKAKQNLASLEKQSTVFPLTVFHPKIQMIIESFKKSFPFPLDWYGLVLLSVSSTIIGNKYAIEFIKGWNTVPIIYGIIVGNSGTGKSKLINLLTKPIKRIESNYYDNFISEREKWKQECSEIENSNQKATKPEEPKPKRIITNDATLESLLQVIQRNPKGIILIRQELMGWINSMNQYRGGSDGEFWLEAWDNEDFIVDRVKNPVKLHKVYCNVLGGIQPDIIEQLAKDERINNGFIPRILFAYPDDLKSTPPTLEPLNIKTTKAYEYIMSFLNNLPTEIDVIDEDTNYYNVKSNILPLDEAAAKLYHDFLKENTAKRNNCEENIERSILAKMDTNILRFALILYLLDLACSKNLNIDIDKEFMSKQKIGIQYIKRAIKLVQYFTFTAFKVISKMQNPIGKLNAKAKAWYEALPEEFQTKTAIELGKGLGMSERSVKRRVNDAKLFQRKSRGVYEKRFV